MPSFSVPLYSKIDLKNCQYSACTSSLPILCIEPTLIRLFPHHTTDCSHQGPWWFPYCKIQWSLLSPHLLIYQQHWLGVMSTYLETLYSFVFQKALSSPDRPHWMLLLRHLLKPPHLPKFQTLEHPKLSPQCSPLSTFMPSVTLSSPRVLNINYKLVILF